MTASRVDLFPCRVQLIGRPRSAAAVGAAASTTALPQTPPRRPPMEKVQGVSRNLFGKPKPGEINRLFQQETERQHSYVSQRYNIDMNILRGEQSEPTTNGGTPSRREQPTHQHLPTLIAQELKQQQQQQKLKEQCNSKRPSEITPPNAKIQQLQSCGGVTKIMRRRSDEALTPTTNVERPKPYARQTLLTDSFNLRKNKICAPASSSSTSSSSSSSSVSPLSSMKQNQPMLAANAEIMGLESSFLDTHRHVQVLQMPQASQTELTINDNTITSTTPTTAAAAAAAATTTVSHYDEEDDEQNECTSSSADIRPRPNGGATTLSLKLLVSTQNALASATSSAS